MATNFILLSSVMTERDPDTVVCTIDGVDIRWQQFISDSSRLYRIIKKEPGSKKYLLYCKSSYQFTVALFSVWQTGSVCVLPPNNSKEVLKKFEHYVDAFITDLPIDETELKIIAPLQNGECGMLDLEPIPGNRILLELFTSGTTGERKCIRKTIANLQLELQEQYKIFGTVLENTRVFSTVSHQHIYGLLHKILLPVCTNRAFVDETYFFPDKLISDMNGGENGSVLISGPSHLKLLPALVNLREMGKYCKAMFSSGSMLDAETSLILKSLSGISPVEVFGSTETGGVAWRIQSETPESKKWIPFPPVQVRKSEEGFLQVKSPFIYQDEPHDEWFTMGDMVDICDDSRFYLYGRGDRIVKIGEKRVSLEEMEKVLCTFKTVHSCVVFPITRNQSGLDRVVLACVVETTETINIDYKKRIINEFKTELLQHFAQILVPKYWRFVQTMPRDAQGKTSVEELKKLFR